MASIGFNFATFFRGISVAKLIKTIEEIKRVAKVRGEKISMVVFGKLIEENMMLFKVIPTIVRIKPKINTTKETKNDSKRYIRITSLIFAPIALKMPISLVCLTMLKEIKLIIIKIVRIAMMIPKTKKV